MRRSRSCSQLGVSPIAATQGDRRVRRRQKQEGAKDTVVRTLYPYTLLDHSNSDFSEEHAVNGRSDVSSQSMTPAEMPPDNPSSLSMQAKLERRQGFNSGRGMHVASQPEFARKKSAHCVPSSHNASRHGTQRLYSQCEHQRAMRASQIQNAEALRLARDMEECTFHPRIHSGSDGGYSGTRLSLYERAVERQHRKLVNERQRLEECARNELDECTFSPDIKQTSRKYSDRRTDVSGMSTTLDLSWVSSQMSTDRSACSLQSGPLTTEDVRCAVHSMLEEWKYKPGKLWGYSGRHEQPFATHNSDDVTASRLENWSVLCMLDAWKRDRQM